MFRLDVKTQVGHLLRRLGVDRLDPTKPYRLGNLALACFACNKARSNTFSATEMHELGPAISRVWTKRLTQLSITWTP